MLLRPPGDTLIIFFTKEGLIPFRLVLTLKFPVIFKKNQNLLRKSYKMARYIVLIKFNENVRSDLLFTKLRNIGNGLKHKLLNLEGKF